LFDRIGISGPVNLPPPCLRRRCPVLHDKFRSRSR